MRSVLVVVKETEDKESLAHTMPGDTTKMLGGEGGGVSKVDGESYPHTGDRTKLRGALVVDKESEAHTTPGEKTKMMGI